MHSPSTPTTISVRFLFLMPLMLHTPVACMRPLVELTGLDNEANVKGAPISLSDDMVSVGPVVCCVRSERVLHRSRLRFSKFEPKKLRVALAVAQAICGLFCGNGPLPTLARRVAHHQVASQTWRRLEAITALLHASSLTARSVRDLARTLALFLYGSI